MKTYFEKRFEELQAEAEDTIIELIKKHGDKCRVKLTRTGVLDAYRLKFGVVTYCYPILDRITPYKGIWYYDPYSDGREHYSIFNRSASALTTFIVADEMVKFYTE